MDSSRKKQFFFLAFIVWAILILAAFTTKHSVYVPGISIGILIGVLNFSSLMASVEKKEKMGSARQKTARLTAIFFLRYLLVSTILVAVWYFDRPVMFVGFLIGFLSLYAVFFADYMRRIKSGT